jgi:hypothetical protein
MRISYQMLLTALLFAVLTAPASAAVVNPVIDFSAESFAKEGMRTVDEQFSMPGDELVILGTVAQFQAPFEDLDANAAGVEYTYVMDGLISLGTTQGGAGSIQIFTTNYSGGAFRIYQDTSPDKDWADPATFADGTLILQGTFSGFQIVTYSFTCAGTQNADLQFTGGSLFSRVSSGGVGTTGIDTGVFNLCASTVDDPLEVLGYFARSDTKIDIVPPTPVTPTTWSQIKQLY